MVSQADSQTIAKAASIKVRWSAGVADTQTSGPPVVESLLAGNKWVPRPLTS